MTLVGITGQESVPLIESLIPIVENWVCNELNNWFLTPNWIEGGNISFTADTTITDSDSNFSDTDVGFAAGMDFRVIGSVLNDGVYSADSVSADTITLDSKYSVVTESFTPTSITINRIVWPQGIKFPVAKVIEFHIQKTKGVVEASVDFDDIGRIPEGILDLLRPWRKMAVDREDAFYTKRMTGRIVPINK